MGSRYAVVLTVVLLVAALAAPAFAQSTLHKDAITYLTDRLTAMQADLGGGQLYDTIDPGEVAPYPSATPDASYTYSGFAARGFVEVVRRMGPAAPAGMLTAAGAAFDGAVATNTTANLTYGDILLGQELGGHAGYAVQRGQATTALGSIADATGGGTAAAIAGTIIADAVATTGTDSGGTWLAGLAALAYSREGTTEMGGTGITGAAIAAEIAGQLDTAYGIGAFTADASPLYLLGWSGLATALTATGNDPQLGAADYLALIVGTQAIDGFYDDSNSDLFSGTAYGIMALRAAIDAGYVGWNYSTSSIKQAGNALADQVVSEITVYGGAYTLGFPGHTGAGIVELDPGFAYGTTGYVEFAQFDGESLFGIAASTPEPGTLALFGCGLLALGAAAWKRRRRGRSE